jgi:hypothetical protein
MPPIHSKIPVIAFVVWCTASIWPLGTLKPVQAEEALQRGEMVRQVCMSYTEQDDSRCISLLEKHLTAAVCNVPETPTEVRSWSTERSHVDLQVPETLVRALLIKETAGRIIDLQVPEALLFLLSAEGL